jgi:hypothetical protein
MRATEQHWLHGADAKAIVAKAEATGAVDYLDLVSIKSQHYAKPRPSGFFKKGLGEMGEHAIS